MHAKRLEDSRVELKILCLAFVSRASRIDTVWPRIEDIGGLNHMKRINLGGSLVFKAA